MYGFWYSARKNFSFTRKEFWNAFWTAVAFGFILSFRKWGAGKVVEVGAGLGNWALAFVVALIVLLLHIAFQKLVAIKLGYKATYTYWLNGILVSVFLVFVSGGYIVFILPGAVMIEHVEQLRLGKFRYGTNLKDVARVALAGPLSHILMIMIIGIFYFAFGKPELLLSIIVVNLFLAVYSFLPIPKIDIPTKMDSGSDGLGVFYFSRTLYVLVLITILAYVALVLAATSSAQLWWFFWVAFGIGCIVSAAYSIAIEQKN